MSQPDYVVVVVGGGRKYLRCYLSGINIFLVIVVRKIKELLSLLRTEWSIFLGLKMVCPRTMLPFTPLPFLDVSPRHPFLNNEGKEKIRYGLNIWRLTLFSLIWTCMWVLIFFDSMIFLEVVFMVLLDFFSLYMWITSSFWERYQKDFFLPMVYNSYFSFS